MSCRMGDNLLSLSTLYIIVLTIGLSSSSSNVPSTSKFYFYAIQNNIRITDVQLTRSQFIIDQVLFDSSWIFIILWCCFIGPHYTFIQLPVISHLSFSCIDRRIGILSCNCIVTPIGILSFISSKSFFTFQMYWYFLQLVFYFSMYCSSNYHFISLLYCSSLVFYL